MIEIKKRKKKPQIITYIIVLFLAFIFVYPFWQTLVLSFSDAITANQGGFLFWPKNFTLEAYEKVFETNTIFVGYANTIFRSVVGCTLTVLATFFAAYAMTRKELPGWSFINVVIVFTMFFGGGLIPNYLNLKSLGLLNTRWVLILPGIAGAYNFLVMRSFLNGVSREIQEAAHIDGAGVYKTMFLVVMPLSKAIMAVIGLWSLVSHWNAWFDSLTYANKKELMVLQTVIRRLIDKSEAEITSGEMITMAESTPMSVRAATVMVATLPILLGYPFVQKYLVKGTMVGSVKG